MDLGLAGAGVVVTGGAGGIGSAIVRAFAAEGAHVAVHHRSSGDAARQLAAEIGGVALHADLTVETDADGLVPAAADALGRVDVVVACAGAWPRPDTPIGQMSLQRWQDTLAANLTATFLTARGFVRHVTATGTGALVLVGSTAGSFGEAGHADYAAAKAALQTGLLLSLKNELSVSAPGARVNAVAPGWTATPMTEGRLSDDAVRRATATMALRKVASPADIAAAVTWLASDRAAGHVTGQLLTVAGGMEGRLLHDPGAGQPG